MPYARVSAWAALSATTLVVTLGIAHGEGVFIQRTVWPPVLFVFTLALSMGVLTLTPAGQHVRRGLDRLAEYLFRRGIFRSNPEPEVAKFALLRIAFGLFLLERAYWILFYMPGSDWQDGRLVFAALANLISALLVTIGLATQVALVFLMVVQWQCLELVLGNSTLGNDIAAILSALLIFSNAGSRLSADALLARRFPRLKAALFSLYYEDGIPSRNTLQIAKLLALFSYWCVCLYSLMMHLSEPAWMNGSAGPLLLTSTFLSQYPDEISAGLERFPFLIEFFRLSLWMMLPWYALLFPFVLIGGILRTYVIAWAVLFFLVSLFVLQLGWLAHFELILFAGLFWDRRYLREDTVIHVAYDDKCNLCDRTVWLVSHADISGRVQLRPLSEAGDWLKAVGLSQEAVFTDIHGVEIGEGAPVVHRGYDLYLALSRQMLLLAPLFPILLLGRAFGVGPAIYRFIADRRRRLFGVCTIPTAQAERPDRKITVRANAIPAGDPVVPASVHLFGLALVYLLLTPAPFVGWWGVPIPKAAENPIRQIGAAAHIYGIAPINVFNQADLTLSENWFTLSAFDEGGREVLLPVMSEDGKRLAMHRSDRVYFGNTLLFRRGTIGRSGCFFDEYRRTVLNLTEQSWSTHDTFLYRQYHQPLPELRLLLEGSFKRADRQEVCEVVFGAGPYRL